MDRNKLLFQNKMQDFSKTCTQRLPWESEMISALNSFHCPSHKRGSAFPVQSTAADKKQWFTGAFRNILVCIKTCQRKQTNAFLAGIIDQPLQKMPPYLLLCHVHIEQVVPFKIFHLILAYLVSANITKSPITENTVRDWISSCFIM